MVENVPQEEDTFFQYIDLNSLDFFFEIKDVKESKKKSAKEKNETKGKREGRFRTS